MNYIDSLNHRHGYLHLIAGPMFSGKTTELFRMLSVANEAGFMRILHVNSAIDTRSFASHNKGINIPENITTRQVQDLSEILPHIDNFDVIGIDEAQFFTDLKDIVINLVEEHNKYVIVAGLDADINRNKFGQILDLIPYCDEIRKIYPFCILCSKNGIIKRGLFSKLVTSKETCEYNDNGNVIKVGGKDKYIPVCRNCFNMAG